MTTVVERIDTPRGEWVLRTATDVGPDGSTTVHHEVIANGTFLMDTRDGRSERLLVRAAVDAVVGDDPVCVLIGGLGVGFSLDEALAASRVGSVVVVEVAPAVLRWNRQYLGRAPLLDDPRTRIVCDDLATYLTGRIEPVDVLCLDVDNGPGWTVVADNAGLYDPDGLARMRAQLTPRGVLAVWSAQPEPEFDAALRRVFAWVRVYSVEVARGAPDVVYLAGADVEQDGAP